MLRATVGTGGTAVVAITLLLSGCADLPTMATVESQHEQEGADQFSAASTSSGDAVRIVTFGDSNTDVGFSGTKNSVVVSSYISPAKNSLTANAANSPLQLAGKIEAQWSELRGTPLVAVNHGAWGTSSGTGRSGGAPNARTLVDGISRFEAEVLGVGSPSWHGGEPVSSSFPDGPVTRVNAFVPDSRSFAYVSMGTNDVKNNVSAAQITANLAWMIDRWTSGGQEPRRFIITTLPPRGNDPNAAAVPIVNDSIRALAARTGAHLVDLAGYTSDDNGLTWRSDGLRVDQVHYSEPVRDWLAQQIVWYMAEVISAPNSPGTPRAVFTVTPGGAYTEGQLLTFDASGSTDPNGLALTYTWTFGDGTSATGSTVTRAYRDNGTYSAVLTVANSSGLSNRAARLITVVNAAPVVNAGSNLRHVVGQPFYFRPTFSDPGVDDGRWLYTVEWGDGTSTSGNSKSQGSLKIGPKSYDAPGKYTLSITVWDKDGAADTDAMELTVDADAKPRAQINGPYAGDEGATILMSSAGTTDPAGGTLVYSWDFGDGTKLSGSKYADVSKKYADDGVYPVRLIVTNSFGAADTAHTTATVANVAPTASFSAPSAILEGSDYTLTMSKGSDASTVDRETLEYALDCGLGDGYSSWSRTVTTRTCPVQVDQRDAITVRGKVRDKDGGEHEYTRLVKVSNAKPEVSLVATSSTTLRIGQTLSVSGSFTDLGVQDAPWTYTISWGYKTPSATGSVNQQGTPIQATHTYVTAGVYSVQMTVRDKDGGSGKSAVITVTVE